MSDEISGREGLQKPDEGADDGLLDLFDDYLEAFEDFDTASNYVTCGADQLDATAALAKKSIKYIWK